ncbi:MAG: hypothetical protein R3A45_02945 [Bdellovibrionota bacterium]
MYWTYSHLSDVVIDVSSGDTWAQPPVSNASLTFTIGNWNTPQTITVTGVNDVGILPMSPSPSSTIGE